MRFVKRAILIFTCVAFTCRAVFAQDPTDPVRAELTDMGKPGLIIAMAREKVIEILQSENSCSAWFQKADPNAAATFTSLKFMIDPKGPQYVIGWRSYSGAMLFKHPYAGRAQENAGASSVVTLNANGPFFTSTTRVLQSQIPGSSPHASGWRTLQVGSYPGDTLAAQITTLLHEFGHVIGRLPDDSDELSGQSARNTAQVLHFCRAQIKAAERSIRHSGP